jgi:uncharacterized metal-binding protein YceD (DUF177 family)
MRQKRAAATLPRMLVPATTQISALSLGELVRRGEMFAVDLPLTVLCRVECKGLSSEGVNLNEHPEAEKIEARKKDSPFSALRDFEV